MMMPSRADQARQRLTAAGWPPVVSTRSVAQLHEDVEAPISIEHLVEAPVRSVRPRRCRAVEQPRPR